MKALLLTALVACSMAVTGCTTLKNVAGED